MLEQNNQKLKGQEKKTEISVSLFCDVNLFCECNWPCRENIAPNIKWKAL